LSGRTGKPLRINEKIKPISPTFQVFIKDLLFNDDAYLIFLQNLKASLAAHGIDISPDLTQQALIDFRFALENARIKLNSDKKLRFEDIFRLTVVTIDEARLKFKPKTVGIDTSVEVYYSEKSSESNRGSNTDFGGSGTVSDKGTDHYSTTKFETTSIFKDDIVRERFFRAPMLSNDMIVQLTKAIETKAS
jgi:hypothetical protein